MRKNLIASPYNHQINTTTPKGTDESKKEEKIDEKEEKMEDKQPATPLKRVRFADRVSIHQFSSLLPPNTDSLPINDDGVNVVGTLKNSDKRSSNNADNNAENTRAATPPTTTNPSDTISPPITIPDDIESNTTSSNPFADIELTAKPYRELEFIQKISAGARYFAMNLADPIVPPRMVRGVPFAVFYDKVVNRQHPLKSIMGIMMKWHRMIHGYTKK